MTPLKRRTKPKSTSLTTPEKTKPPIGLISALVGVVLVALILMFQDEINTMYSGKSKRGSQEPERTLTPLAIPEQTVSERLQREAPHENKISSEVTQTASSVESSDGGEEFIAPSSNEIIPSNKPGTHQAAATSMKEAISTAATTATYNQSLTTARPVNSAPTLQRTEALAVNINRELWLLEQNPNHFTLQLVAGYQKSTVNNFLRMHKLPATELAYYHGLNKDKDWHSLVYGVFPDYSSAKNSIGALPKSLQKSKPWIRQLKTIQNEIKEGTSGGTSP